MYHAMYHWQPSHHAINKQVPPLNPICPFISIGQLVIPQNTTQRKVIPSWKFIRARGFKQRN
jgi:hypothetical protein